MAAVVADNGSGTCEGGFAGDDAPRVELLYTVFVVMKGRQEKKEEKEKGKEKEKREKREERTKERRGETREKREKRERKKKERERERERDRHAKNPPCVDSTRLRAHRQDASVCTGNGPACVQHAGLLPVHTEAS